MKNIIRCTTLAVAIGLSSCVQYPTQEAKVADMRPGVSFVSSKSTEATVMIDGQQVGTVGEFMAGHSVLRVQSGTHRIQVMDGSASLFDQKVYLGDGVSKTLRID